MIDKVMIETETERQGDRETRRKDISYRIFSKSLTLNNVVIYS